MTNMIATNRRPRAIGRAAVTLAIVAGALLWSCTPRGAVLPEGEVAGSGVQEDYDAARSRLAAMLVKVQQVEGLVPQGDLVPVVASLNQALDKLELAGIALAGGFLSQASANITAANGIMEAVSPAIDALVARAEATGRANLLLAAAGIGAACVAAVFLFWLKRRHDKKKLRTFLDAEIDYGGAEQPDARDKAEHAAQE